MRLQKPLVKLPIGFSATVLEREINDLPRSAWTPHPSGFPGNEAVRLATPQGKDNDGLFGPMAPTEHLLRCPCIMDVMAELGAVWGRARLMALGPGAEVPGHVDINYYWRTHIRVHVPIVTNPAVEFTCGGQTINMAAGECWVLDTFQSHRVANRGTERRVHLVLDTVGGERLWDLVRAGESGEAAGSAVEPKHGEAGALQFEQTNAPAVMSPWEIKCHFAELLAATKPEAALEQVSKCLDRFTTGWAAAWARFEADEAGLPVYEGLLDSVRNDLAEIGGDHLTLANGRPLYFALDVLVFSGATGRHEDAGRRVVFSRREVTRRLAS